MRRGRAATAVLLASCALVGGCGVVMPAQAVAPPAGVLTISNDNGEPWTCQFNPFNGAVSQLAIGPVYEPLVFMNALRNGQATPWLATSWRWSDGNRTLTFTIRKDVRFSNGEPLTAADVVATFALLEKYPALDENDVWAELSGVTRRGADQVVMTFTAPDVPYFYYIATQVPIVPERIWSRLKDPATFPDTHPVGTGAFTVRSCVRSEIVYAANRRYWRPGEPHVAAVRYPAFTTNDPATTALATGAAQWGSQFIPNVRAFYLSQDPEFRAWFPPTTDNSLIINLKDPALSDVAVRQAMAYAIDRPRVSRIGEYGYEPPANQADIVTPTFAGWLDKPQLAAYGYTYDPAKARQLLAAAGYRPGPGGVRVNRAGQRLSFTVTDIGAYSDWVASVNLIRADLKAVGIAVRPVNLSANAYSDRLSYGTFQLGYGSQPGGPTPFYELQQWLYSPYSAPIHLGANSDYERYESPATDQLIRRYSAATSVVAQHQLVDQLQRVVLADVPFIPVTESVDWYEYDTRAFSGWPTPRDPYAQPSVYSVPDWGQILLRLRPK